MVSESSDQIATDDSVSISEPGVTSSETVDPIETRNKPGNLSIEAILWALLLIMQKYVYLISEFMLVFSWV